MSKDLSSTSTTNRYITETIDDQTILITGGTGSLGKVLLSRLLSEEIGVPRKIIIFSRDEAKQHSLRVEYQQRIATVKPKLYQNFQRLVEFRIGDVRNYHSVAAVARQANIIFNAAALKQVPACEYAPFEAVETNIAGPENIIRAIRENNLPVKTVIGISTDKACKPVNVMGMTKALQERLFIQANMDCPTTRFACVRYGNVLASRGSVIPLFHEQIRNGGPVTITTIEMTRFLLSLNQAVDTVFDALRYAQRGETFIPRVRSARIIDLVEVMIDECSRLPIQKVVTGIRPGEKLHEILVSEEESHRTIERGKYYVILPILPNLNNAADQPSQSFLEHEFSSADVLMKKDELADLLRQHNLLSIERPIAEEDELLR